uniref:Uncharacterized protein n=1 Tax=Desertifilum tharense IPPAS B-1220 TaxID=1781255 RepID=A0ACD5GVF3_9CYAN
MGVGEEGSWELGVGGWGRKGIFDSLHTLLRLGTPLLDVQATELSQLGTKNRTTPLSTQQ